MKIKVRNGNTWNDVPYSQYIAMWIMAGLSFAICILPFIVHAQTLEDQEKYGKEQMPNIEEAWKDPITFGMEKMAEGGDYIVEQPTCDNDQPFNDSAGSANRRFSQSFDETGVELGYVGAYLKKVGSPTNDVILSIQGDSGGVPDNTDIASCIITNASIGTDYALLECELDTPVTLDSTELHLVGRGSGNGSTSNYFRAAQKAPSTEYANGHKHYSDASLNWYGEADNDMCFTLQEVAPTPTPTPTATPTPTPTPYEDIEGSATSLQRIADNLSWWNEFIALMTLLFLFSVSCVAGYRIFKRKA